MKKILLALALVALLPAALMAQPVPQDTAFRTGRLKNGLTYYIRHNAKEAGMADFYIAQRVGSILEEPRQRGLAHFLEHMAFNGSQNFQGTAASPSIVHWCEAHGIKFGANLNAYTSIDETVYHVSSVPVTREQNIDSCLLILHDWSHYLNLTDQEIDKERGVIHEEWRTRRAGMASQRMMEDAMPIVYRGSKYADCMPIGSMDIVDHFPYQDLRDYYHKWYRPDLQAIIVVGDVDVDRMEQKIVSVFGSIPMPPAAAERIYYPVPDNEDMIVALLKDKEQPIMLATLHMKREATPDSLKPTVQHQREDYVDDLIAYMTGERLDEMQKADPKPCLSASARLGSFLISRTKDAFSLSFGARQENVRGSFAAAVGTVERIRQHGFTQAELDRAKAFRQKAVDRMYNERNDRKNGYYVRKAQAHFLQGEPMTTEAYDRQLCEQLAGEVTLDEVNRATREAISDRNQVLVVYAPDRPDFAVPTEGQLRQYVLEAQAQTYAPYQERPVAERLMDKLPRKGRIVSEKPSMHGTTEITLSNGVKVYYRHTDYQKDQLSMRFFGEGGTSLYPDADVPNFSLISTAITKAGVANFDETTLGKMLSGKTVRVQPSIGNETQAINGTSSVKDAETLFQLVYLYFTQPRRDDVAFKSELDRMRSFLTNREASPNVSYNDSLAAIVYGNSPRVQPVKAATLDRVSYDRILQIYRERFSNASNFKMILLGNLPIERVRPLLEQYVASLPSTGRHETFADTYPHIRQADETRLWKRPMSTPLAKVTIFYSWDEPFTPKADLTLDVLRRVLSIAYTDSVREEKGGVYGVGLEASIDKTSKPTSLLKIQFTTDPAKYAMVIPIVYRQLDNIARKGPEPTSMQKVKEYLSKQYGQAAITNDYWNYVLYNQLRYGIDYDRDYLKLVDGVTPADVQQMAGRLLQSHRRIEVTMQSE